MQMHLKNSGAQCFLKKTIHEKIYQNWKKKEPPIDHSRAASLMLDEIHKDNAAI